MPLGPGKTSSKSVDLNCCGTRQGLDVMPKRTHDGIKRQPGRETSPRLRVDR